jgi:DNA-binding transcriptional MerR regulator
MEYKMQINSNPLHANNIYNPAHKDQNANSSFSASMFMEQVDPEIARLFEEYSAGLDPDTKLKRAMSMSLHLSSGPMFLRFKDGNYPEAMPDDIKASMQEQNKEWDALKSDKDKNIYTLDWMIDHIVHERSDDPEFENFLKDIRASYAGESKSDFKSRDEINDDDAALQQFKKDLTSKGALKFLYDFNMERIEEMVEKYREDLLKNLGENPSPEELAEIEKMVEDYRKKLLEQLAEINDKNKNSSLNIKRLEFEMINKIDSRLEEVLQNI